MTEVSSDNPSTKKRNYFVLLPLIAFLGLAALFFIRLGAGDASRLPSALIGHPAPKTELPPLAGLERDGKAIPGLSNADFEGQVTLVNVWASWCIPCRDEVAYLEQLSKDKRIKLVGINYKDAAADARRFLSRFGNPFVASGVDSNGLQAGWPAHRRKSRQGACAGNREGAGEALGRNFSPFWIERGVGDSERHAESQHH
jgi:cytochrome c biogenesis protein CcmG/thiol:disulfide interchange protein DsbE